MALREVVDFLILIQSLVQVALATGRAPQDIPLVGLGRSEAGGLNHGANKLVVETEHLVEQLTVLDVVALLITVELHRVGHHLLVRDVLEHKELRLILVVVVTRRRSAVSLVVKESGVASVGATHRRVDSAVRNVGGGSSGHRTRSRRPSVGRHHPFELVFQLLELDEDFANLTLALFLLDGAFTDGEHAFAVYEIAGTGSAGELAVDALPVLLEVRLDVL
mmetsp:Transcript_24551/g.38081  ORF Transcript_24551/g.38081 Transcript_24551/m.38081 type:complete len:221 (-) Transcript_24551:373-1035(-)|eukprot:CAMPEP_0170495030 /NCGR_PEP_ID=MMETSP0208-20121228/14974_1 /TAXON_ID=197538 /ORGANISM="Strombidium inclinatum, Strain S3" /LENGTH=220 /DNA_ID=CAMNT_0010771165 /DNA_START=2797 /DNA_END=3459 /DNA_ORIENTATION=+